MNRCNQCILPENYPGISFNDTNVCNFCTNYKEREYLGPEALKKDIIESLNSKKNRNKEYDCLVALSGGRDSTYLLYYLVKKLELKVLGYFADNGFIPKQTIRNIKKVVNQLNVKLVINRHRKTERCFSHHLATWLKQPSPATVGILCTGCKLGIYDYIHVAKNFNIPLITYGWTPFEGMGYKRALMNINTEKSTHTSFILGYLSHILNNPGWITNLTCVSTQLQEYLYYLTPFRVRSLAKWGSLELAPFDKYIEWNEKEVVDTIQNKLGWEKPTGIISTWRSDCHIALLKTYLYRELLGFNDKDDNFSCLIRAGQLSRENALKRLKIEGSIPEKVLVSTCEKLGTDYATLKEAVARYKSRPHS